jgi:hypothetical protein
MIMQNRQFVDVKKEIAYKKSIAFIEERCFSQYIFVATKIEPY